MTQSVYIIAQLNVKDFPQYRDQYGRLVVAQLAEAGAELLAASARGEVLEGEWPANWTVIIRFPTREAAMAWYQSSEYAPLRQARIEALTSGGNVVLLPGRE